MATGTVKNFNEAKGVGFITPDDGSADIVAHVSETVQPGDKVEYEVVVGKFGRAATGVRVS